MLGHLAQCVRSWHLSVPVIGSSITSVTIQKHGFDRWNFCFIFKAALIEQSEKRTMEHEFWPTRWQKGEIGFHEGAVNQSLCDHGQEFSKDIIGSVFVPLCGAVRLVTCGGCMTEATRWSASS